MDLELKSNLLKTIALGDTHGRSFWKMIVHKEDPDRIVFIGDYFDTHDDISAAMQMYNFNEIINYKKESGKDVILLIGNHDFHYFPEVGDVNTTGYQDNHADEITKMIGDNKDHLQMAYLMDNFLFTHAGVGEEWLIRMGWEGQKIDDFINEVFKKNPRDFDFFGWDPYGDNVSQTPIWIRPHSLIVGSRNIREFFRQVVGHTSMKRLDLSKFITNGKYFFIDTLGTSGEYLIIEDGETTVGNI